MEAEKGKTAKYLKEKREVSSRIKENLKRYTRIRKSILNAMRDGEMTVPQLAEKLNMPSHEVMFYLMSLLKYGAVEVAGLDDADEYFYYKIKG